LRPESFERHGGASPLLNGGRPALFIVFGHQRTGSTLLASKLNSHPRIRCHEEVFLPWVDSDPSLRQWLRERHLGQALRILPNIRTTFLASLSDASAVPSDVRAIGFKVMYNQLSAWPTLGYLAPGAGRLLQDPALRGWLRANRVLIVHTLRRNHLKIIVSHKLAEQSRRFHSRDAIAECRKVLVPVLGLKLRLRRLEQAERAARHSIAGLPCIEIWYEDYVAGGAHESDARVCAALGLSVPAGGLTSALSKVSSDNLREAIINYEQVAAHLSGSRFERFLS
jgi:LPS sulfotransferase NodH